MGKLLHIHHQDMFELNMFHTVDDSDFLQNLVNHGIHYPTSTGDSNISSINRRTSQSQTRKAQ